MEKITENAGVWGQAPAQEATAPGKYAYGQEWVFGHPVNSVRYRLWDEGIRNFHLPDPFPKPPYPRITRYEKYEVSIWTIRSPAHSAYVGALYEYFDEHHMDPAIEEVMETKEWG